MKKHKQIFLCMLNLLIISSCSFSGANFTNENLAENPTWTRDTPIPQSLPDKTLVQVKINTITPVNQSGQTATITLAEKVDPTEIWELKERDLGEEIGYQIVAALERYYQDKGNYPGTLEGLVPNYLDEVPKTYTGYIYYYDPYETDYYILIYPWTRVNTDQRKVACLYSNRSIPNDWECGTGLYYPWAQ
jgi:hypothetical protein